MLARKTLMTLSLGLAVGLVCLSSASAQTTQPAAMAPMATTEPAAPAMPATPAAPAPAPATEEVPNAKYSFIGVVNGSNVNVRCGPAESYYVTMQLSKGDHVVAMGYRFNWLKIAPPKGSFSYISKNFVRREPGGNTGSVTGANVRVYAGSSMNQLKAQKQTELSSGDKVTIVGEAEEFYKIVPPAGVYLYVAKQFVEPVRQATARETEAAPAAAAGGPEIRPLDHAAPAPAAPGEETGAAAAPAPAAPEAELPAAPAGSPSAELARLNAQFEAVQKEPQGQRPLTELRQGYEALAAREDVPLSIRRAAESRLDMVRLLEQQQNEIVTARKEAAAFRAKQADYENQTRQIETRLKQAGVSVYTAVGQMQTSTIQQGDQPLYRLVDPADGQTVVYIRTTDPAETKMLGQFVGVRGEVVSDQRLSVKVISPMAMEPVDPSRVLRGVTALYYPASILKGRTVDVQGATTQPATEK